jgi:hypothetical protein
MASSDITISTYALTRILIILAYAPVCLVCYWRLIPRLAPGAKRLASVMLGAQILVLLLALEAKTSSIFDQWLVDLNGEWNIPTTIASVQLAMTVSVAFLTAWLARSFTRRVRLYLVGAGLALLLFLLDEHLSLHESNRTMVALIIAIGTGLAAATAAIAWRAPMREKIWHICLLIGLGISGLSALVVDKMGATCDQFGPLVLDGCVFYFQLEEALELLGIWLVLIALLGHFAQAAPRISPHARRVLLALPLIWVSLYFAYALFPRLELRLLAQPASIDFEGGIRLRGFRLETSGSHTRVHLYATAKQQDYMGLGYSIHLVDQVSGESIASDDKWAGRHHSLFFLGPAFEPVYRQSMEVVLPPHTPANRAYWVVLTTWRMNRREFLSQVVVASDHRQLNASQIVLDELVTRAPSPVPTAAPLASFSNGFTLYATNLPESSGRGAILPIQFTWRSDIDTREAFVQFLHLGHEESGEWWVYDQHPLGPRLPTRLWYSGLSDSETWLVPLPDDLAPGTYSVYTGLYRTDSGERIAVSDAEGKPYRDARVRLGQITVEA